MTKGFAPNTTVSPEVFSLVKKLEGVIVGRKFTIDGEVFVCKRGDVPFELPLEVEDYEGKVLTSDLAAGMTALFNLTKNIHSKPQRMVPPTREEFRTWVEETNVRTPAKKVLRDLESKGLIQERLISLQKASTILDKGGKPMLISVGARACIMFTNQGRSYVRATIDSSYGLGGKEHWDGVKDSADEIRRVSRQGSGAGEHTEGEHGGDEPSVSEPTDEGSGGFQRGAGELGGADGVQGQL